MKTTILCILLLLTALYAEEKPPKISGYMVLLSSVPKDQPGVDTILKGRIDVSCADCDLYNDVDKYFLSDTIQGLRPGYYVLTAGVYSEKYLAMNYLDCMKERFPSAYLKKVTFPSKEVTTISKEYNYIYCETGSAKKLAHILYPLCRPTFNKKAGEGRWSLEISDVRSFTFQGDKYSAYCWAEYHATCARTNYKEYHRGGLAIIKGDSLICKTSITDIEFNNIVPEGDLTVITLFRSSEYHGYVSEDFYTFAFEGDSLELIDHEDLGGHDL